MVLLGLFHGSRSVLVPGDDHAVAGRADAAAVGHGATQGSLSFRIIHTALSTIVTVVLLGLYAWGGLYPRIAYLGANVFAMYGLAAVAVVAVMYGSHIALTASAPDQPDTPGRRATVRRGAWFTVAMYVRRWPPGAFRPQAD